MTIDARAVSNRHLTCDFCGIIPATLYLPTNNAGVFCERCLAGVLNPPPVTLAADEEAGYVDLGRKLDTYLKQFRREAVFCGRGRPRKKPVEIPKPANQQSWKYFDKCSRVRIIVQKPFKGIRARVWAQLSDGATIGEVLTRCTEAGLAEAKVVSALRKMIKVYRVLAVERQQSLG